MQQQKKTSFQDVRDEVMRRIEARVWDQGALLPTEADLAEEFGCARATVNRALREVDASPVYWLSIPLSSECNGMKSRILPAPGTVLLIAVLLFFAVFVDVRFEAEAFS